MRDFVLVELMLEQGKTAGSLVCYVAQVKGLMEDGSLTLSYLRMKPTCLLKDTFTFPAIPDEATVSKDQCKGVLAIKKDNTKRQADIIKV